MTVSLEKVRGFVYGNGALWERALFGSLFETRPLEQLHACLLAYKNPDGGFGHGLEHDLKCPDSNPLGLEFLLSVNRDTGVPVTKVLEGTPEWVLRNRAADGSLLNPASLRDYPLASWWAEWGGQRAPDSITGNLLRLGLCPPPLAESTKSWVLENLTLEKVKANEWLFMAYHAFDYFMNVEDFPDLGTYREAMVQNIVACAENAPEGQYGTVSMFAPTPKSPLAQRLPKALLKRALDYLMDTQREDGSWKDEHDLPQWFPYTTIRNLLTLKRYGRLS
jgi:hypothetical protein